VPAERALVFTLGPDGVQAAEAVAVTGPDGARREVSLPLGAAVAAAGGRTVPLVALPAP